MPTDSSSELTLDRPSDPPFEVMTRALVLPTASLRQARAIVRLQLDRLSPLPPKDVVFDLVRLQTTGAESRYALGLLRRSALQTPHYASRRVVTASRVVDDVQVLFRFRNRFAVDDREARWLTHAPRAALIALCLSAVALAGQIRADQWRTRTLPEIAALQRAAAVQARDARGQADAVRDWSALDRGDASTRLLCVAGRLGRPAVPVIAVVADTDRITVTPVAADGVERLERLDGKVLPASGGARPVVEFSQGACS